MKEIILTHKLSVFILNTNIGAVDSVFSGKVEPWVLDHLKDKVAEYQKEPSNSSAWLRFICNLDAENTQILINHILNQGS